MITGSDVLLRRIPDLPEEQWIRGGNGVVRATSAAMKPTDDDGCLSVDVRRLLPDPGDPCSVLERFPNQGLCEFLAQVARDLDLRVDCDPIPGNPAHACISGFDAFSEKVAKRKRKDLALACVWIRMPASAMP